MLIIVMSANYRDFHYFNILFYFELIIFYFSNLTIYFCNVEFHLIIAKNESHKHKSVLH